jgi:hypothetical protein|tara:strand:+ start:505 stop:768 length:264 start_codon:yes stop_codon:yes gene_type:complete
MSDWREQLKINMGLGSKTIKDLYEVLKFSPDLPLQSIYSALQQRGHRRLTTKTLRKYMAKDPKILSKIDMRQLHHRPTVYYLKEEEK